MKSKWKTQSWWEPCLPRTLEKLWAEGKRKTVITRNMASKNKMSPMNSPSQSSQSESPQIFWLYLLKNNSKHFLSHSNWHVWQNEKDLKWFYSITCKEQCLAEITPQVVLTYCLNSEQVQNIRRHISDDCFLQETICTYTHLRPLTVHIPYKHYVLMCGIMTLVNSGKIWK